jgi:diacylglycerol O-acyltransferase / wax synthase
MTKAHFEPLVGLDTWFLYGERHEAPLHIGATYIFEGTTEVKGGRGALGLARTVEERLHLVPRYRQKLMWRPGNVGNPVWVDDPDFDLSFHIRRAALPSPGDNATLRDYTARVFARPLDLDKPLWEMTIVEGLTEGRVAVVSKVHHAMVDGISTVDLATLLLDPTPEPAKFGRPKKWKARPAPTQSELLRNALENLSPFEAGKQFLRFRPNQLVEAVMRSPWSAGLQLALTWLRPGAPLFFNRPIGPHRRVHSVRVPLQALKDMKTSWGGTVNDAVLAVIGEAMSRWLFDRGEMVPETMRVFAPVSVRDETERYALGNLVSGMVVDVPLAPMLPRDRINMVTAATGDLKQLANWAPATVQGLAGRVMTSQLRSSPQSIVNLVATNIPGPQFPFYTGGAKLVDVWPFVSIYHSLGLNIAIVSYDGGMSFGLLADRDLVPDLDDFARHLEQTVADYQDAALAKVRKPARSGSRPARPRKQAAKKPVHLGVHDESAVASPNGDGGNVRPQAAAKVHHLV